MIKKLSVCLVLAFLFFAGIVSCSTPKAELFNNSWDDLSIYKDTLITAEQPILDHMQGATVYHVSIIISPDMLTVTGREQARYTNREKVPLSEIYFRLFPNIAGGWTNINSVTVESQEAEFELQPDPSTLQVVLPDALQPGSAVTVDIDFTVDIPQSPGGNYGIFGFFNDILALDCFYPVIPVYDDSGWHIEVGPSFGDKTFLDASFYLVQVTAPKKLVLAVSGSEVKREIINDSQVVTFAIGPARDFYLVGSSRFDKNSSTVGETTINNYFFQETEDPQNALFTAQDSLKIFNQRFSVYPYKELDIVPLNLIEGALGIEYPGICGISTSIYSREDYLRATVAHEIAHQWFYNMIGNDQVNEPWLDEAAAQYAASLYFLDLYGENTRNSYRQSWINAWNRINQQKIPVGLPVYGYSLKEYSAVVYGRGPLFMESLAEKIGQSTFDACLRQYCQSNKWNIVTTESFLSQFEGCSTVDLNELFADWILP